MTSAFHDPSERLSQVEGGLREGWTDAVLEELVLHALGGEWGVSCEKGILPAGHVEVRVLRGTEFRDWEEEKGKTAARRAIKKTSLAKRELRPGDLVIEISGGGPDQPVGRALLIDEEAMRQAGAPLVCSNFCRQIRLHPDVDPAWVALVLRHHYERGDFNVWQSQTTNIRNLAFKEFLAGVSLPLPPLAEQRRIVARAEELLAQERQVGRRLAKLPVLLRRFRQSVLAHAFSGRLTAGWRARHRPARELARFSDATDWEVPEPLDLPDIPETWTLVALNDLVSRIQYGTSMRADGDAKTGVPVLRMSNIQEGRIDMTSVKHVERTAGLESFRLEPGDILFNRTNSPGLVGKAAVFDSDEESVFASYLVRLACNGERVSSRFVCAWINSPWGRQWARTVRTDCVSQSNINTSKLRRMPVPTPPLAEQQEIVRRMDMLLRFADAVEARVAAATLRADRLAQAVLDRALRGDLVPTEADLAREEGRSYEPGWVLLGRIKAQTSRRKLRAGRGADLSAIGSAARRGDGRNRTVAVYDPHQILMSFRQVCWGAGAVSEDELIRRVADRLGVARLGRKVRARLVDHLEIAIDRRIVVRRNGLLEGATPTFARYDDDFLLQVLRTVLRAGVDYDMAAVVRSVASHLGYSQVTTAVRNRMESLMRTGARRGLFVIEEDRIRKRG